MQAKGLWFPRQGGRRASELLVQSPTSSTNWDGKKLLEASKLWLASGVSLRTASLEHLSERFRM